jgi:hypothetical protein
MLCRRYFFNNLSLSIFLGFLGRAGSKSTSLLLGLSVSPVQWFRGHYRAASYATSRLGCPTHCIVHATASIPTPPFEPRHHLPDCSVVAKRGEFGSLCLYPLGSARRKHCQAPLGRSTCWTRPPNIALSSICALLSIGSVRFVAPHCSSNLQGEPFPTSQPPDLLAQRRSTDFFHRLFLAPVL